MHKGRARKFLIASHGKLASGIKTSLDLIAGETENVFIIEAYLEGGPSLEPEIERVMSQITSNDELVIFTDLFGGSVTNQLVKFAQQENIHLVAGFNLALLIEVALADPEEQVNAIVANAVRNAREQIVYVNELMELNKTME